MQNVVVYSKYYYLTLKRNRVKLQNIRGLIRKQTDNDASESEELCGIFFSHYLCGIAFYFSGSHFESVHGQFVEAEN